MLLVNSLWILKHKEHQLVNLLKLPEILYTEYNEIFIYSFIYLWFLNLKIKTKFCQAKNQF